MVASDQKFDIDPILNSPYEKPEKHWQLNSESRPTGLIVDGRRISSHLVPIPAAQRRRHRAQAQPEFELEEEIKENPIVNRIRDLVDKWRCKKPDEWNVTFATRKLLSHWRQAKTTTLRPFFCQVEAAETLIWLNEVAPNTADGRKLLEEIKEGNEEANPGLFRIAAKMATGSGKTTVMAMMIAYHTINKARAPKSSRFSNNFLIITPGITIKDRLRVLYPSDPNSMYDGRGIVPKEFVQDIQSARIVITNYHAFKRRKKIKITKASKELMNIDESQMIESAGQMLNRVCDKLLRSKDVIVINDEAHHCYQQRPGAAAEKLSADDREEASKNNNAARLWISGVKILNESKKAGLKCIYDLSATPFFLRGSGYAEGNLFPWVVSDFALMDAIECGIVKLPRVPIDDGTDTEDNLPIYRNLYKHIRKDLPKKGKTKQGYMNPEDVPATLQAAIQILYSNYEKTHKSWKDSGLDIPPVFIIVCNNTSTSKLVYDYIAGYEVPDSDGKWRNGEFELFNNVDTETGKPLSRMRTLLIDSQQLDSGEAMNPDFKKAAANEIDTFKKEMRARFPDRDITKITDEDLLREVMNTVGKKDRLGEQIHCVVSVSMLTEGWDTNNITHILGVRAFGTQLLCEQVVGRGLRRYSYDLEDNGLFKADYADVFGVPFTFATGTKVEPPEPLKPSTRIRALPERGHLAISYPRVRGYTIKMPDEKLVANFDENSRIILDPQKLPSKVEHGGIVGKTDILTLEGLQKQRENEVVFQLAAEAAKILAKNNIDEQISPARFRDLVPITRLWLKDYLTCLPGTFMQYMLLKDYLKKGAEAISRACLPLDMENKEDVYIPVVDTFTPEGSSFFVDFLTRQTRIHETRNDKCHVNLAICDSDWEMNFCQMLEDDAGVYAYVRNDGLSFEVPYTYKKEQLIYEPDFIALINDGHGKGDLLHLVIEIKGLIDDKSRAKADTMNRLWVPSVNNDGRWGRWDFVEIADMQAAREKLHKFTTANH